MENSKIQKFKCDILSNFQTTWSLYFWHSLLQRFDIEVKLIWLLKLSLTVRVMRFVLGSLWTNSSESLMMTLTYALHLRHVLFRMMLMTRRLSPTLCFHLKSCQMSWAIFKTLRLVDTCYCKADGLHRLHNTENHLRNNLCKTKKEELIAVAAFEI